MREIKFRAWDNQMGCFATEHDNDVVGDTGLIFCQGGYFMQYDRVDNVEKHVLRFNFEQYTGIKDKNGVEIYEGDVVKICGSIDAYDPFDDEDSEELNKYFELTSSVEWCNVHTGFNLKTISSNGVCSGWSLCSEDDALDIKVIGNIHEVNNG